MAIGVDSGEKIVENAAFSHIRLVDASDDTYTGTWVDCGDFQTGHIYVLLTDTGTVQVMGSSAATRPTDATDGTQIGTDITATGFTSLTSLPRFLKTKVTAAGDALSVFGVFRRTSR